VARVLIAEPEPDLRQLAEQGVLELGHEAVLLEAHTAGGHVDVLLLATSPEAVAIARAQRQHHPALPIVCLGTLDASAEIRRLRPVAHLLKPYTLNELARALTQAVAIHHQSTQSGTPIPRHDSHPPTA
jgi:CheY-like chemotaxis protein